MDAIKISFRSDVGLLVHGNTRCNAQNLVPPWLFDSFSTNIIRSRNSIGALSSPPLNGLGDDVAGKIFGKWRLGILKLRSHLLLIDRLDDLRGLTFSGMVGFLGRVDKSNLALPQTGALQRVLRMGSDCVGRDAMPGLS